MKQLQIQLSNWHLGLLVDLPKDAYDVSVYDQSTIIYRDNDCVKLCDYIYHKSIEMPFSEHRWQHLGPAFQVTEEVAKGLVEPVAQLYGDIYPDFCNETKEFKWLNCAKESYLSLLASENVTITEWTNPHLFVSKPNNQQ